MGVATTPEPWEADVAKIVDYLLTYGTLIIVLVYIVFDILNIGRREYRRFREQE